MPAWLTRPGLCPGAGDAGPEVAQSNTDPTFPAPRGGHVPRPQGLRGSPGDRCAPGKARGQGRACRGGWDPPRGQPEPGPGRPLGGGRGHGAQVGRGGGHPRAPAVRSGIAPTGKAGCGACAQRGRAREARTRRRRPRRSASEGLRGQAGSARGHRRRDGRRGPGPCRLGPAEPEPAPRSPRGRGAASAGGVARPGHAPSCIVMRREAPRAGGGAWLPREAGAGPATARPRLAPHPRKAGPAPRRGGAGTGRGPGPGGPAPSLNIDAARVGVALLPLSEAVSRGPASA